MEVNENVDDVEGDQERHFVHLNQTDSHLLFHRKISFFFLLERDLLSPLVKLFPVSQHQNDPYVEWGMGSVMLVSNLQSGVSTP